jgi:hypothetical protein
MANLLSKFKLCISCVLLANLPAFAAGERQNQLLDIVQVVDSAVKSGEQPRLEITMSYQMLSQCLQHAVTLSDGEDAGIVKWSVPMFVHYKSAAIAQTAYCQEYAKALLKFFEATRAPSGDLYAMRSVVEKLQRIGR